MEGNLWIKIGLMLVGTLVGALALRRAFPVQPLSGPEQDESARSSPSSKDEGRKKHLKRR